MSELSADKVKNFLLDLQSDICKNLETFEPKLNSMSINGIETKADRELVV